jgi:hypothetical protein
MEHVNAVEDSVILRLHLRLDFYKIIFKIKHKSSIKVSLSPHPPEKKILVAHLLDVMYANASSKNMKFCVKIICSLSVT